MQFLVVSFALLLAVGEPDVNRAKYLTSVHKQVLRTAPKSKANREVIVVVDIESSGHLSSLRIDKSSGDPAIDESVLRAVLRASPFEPLPTELKPKITGVQIRFYSGNPAK